MQFRESEQTLTTLANASELVRVIAQGVVGNEIADTLNGAPIVRSTIFNIAQTRFQAIHGKNL